MARACVAELIATFTLTFIGVAAICGGHDLVVVALAHGLAIAGAVYASAHISGGHVNPAVTISMLVTGRIEAPKAAGYVVCQLAGAVLGAFTVQSLLPSSATEAHRLGATLADPDSRAAIGVAGTLTLEAIVTFLLVITIFGVAVDKRAPKNVYGLAIGLAVTFDILAVGPLTGASMNPARSFGPALVGEHWAIHWVYWIGPILGACAAALLYDKFLITDEGREGAGS